jgi:tryptophan aminotransferase
MYGQYGCNPSGVTTSEHRRREILQLAEEHDFLVLEGLHTVEPHAPPLLTSRTDDPYYYLYYGNAPRPQSYFKLEEEVCSTAGRVLRFDSFSKILSAGLRIGFASGPKPIIDAMDMHVSPPHRRPCAR